MLYGWVYFIAGGGRTKIGWCHGAAEGRLRTIQLLSPVPLRLVYASRYPRVRATRMERDLHRSLDDRRAHGEWFEGEMSREECIAAIRALGPWLSPPPP